MIPPVAFFQIFTIGHSNRSFEDLVFLLKEFNIRALADVRRFPSSRKFPHFNRDPFKKQLEVHGICYIWFEALGGFRSSVTKKESPNTGLENPGFRNYADHMMTAEFREATEQIIALAKSQTTTIMCAEKFYWKCHRLLLSDFLIAQGVEIKHIVDHGQWRPHRLSPGVIVRENGAIVYPSSPPLVLSP